jgi:hypothetical protein
MRSRWRYLLAGGLVLLLAGCGSNGGTSDYSSAAVAPVPGAAPKQSGPANNGATHREGAAQPSVPGTTDRKLARSARISLTTSKIGDVVARARAIATGAGGYPGQESTTDKSASLTLSVPAAKLDGVLDQLGGLGEVARREISAQDVTAQVIDVDARLKNQRASVERIRALLAKAESVSDIASVEGELTSRQSELESLEQQQASLAGQVAMATVALSVSTSARAAEESGGFLAGLSGGWNAFLDFCGWALHVLGAVAPFAVVFGVPLGFGLWWLRRRRRARRAQFTPLAE